MQNHSSAPGGPTSHAEHDDRHGHSHNHDHDHNHDHSGLFGQHTELIFASLCGALLVTGWLLSWMEGMSTASWTCFLVAYLFGGYFAFLEALESIFNGRFEIDFLMLLAAVGAAVLGDWFDGALLLFLFSVGHSLEGLAMGRAKRAIESLAELAPQTALVKRAGTAQVLPIEEVQVDDIVIVKPNERLAVDGFVVQGSGSINQAPITGESVPVEKQAVIDVDWARLHPDRLDARHRVFAGTINGNSALEIQVSKLARDSTLARVVQMVHEAESKKSPTQLFTNQFERYFVPTTLCFVFLLLFACLVIEEPFSKSFYRAMAVLVAASPCALAISTPSAVLSGIARAARGGVLVKGGGPLEVLGRLGAIAFDKTGTLTEGRPKLTDVYSTDDSSDEELLQIAIAVERMSDHPVAASIVKGGIERQSELSSIQVVDIETIPGLGVKGKIGREAVYLGNEKLFAELEGPTLPDSLLTLNAQWISDGKTTVVVRLGDRYLGLLGLIDAPRQSAREVISQLRQLGIGRLIMLSGDNQPVASRIADEVGIDEAIGDLLPEGKVEAIRKLASEHGVAMVGDGVNDAPAMANATVGIAMGAAGSDVALETADVALMGDDLHSLPFAVGLSRQANRIIRQNIWLSLGMIAFLVPATIFGLPMGPAVVLHEGSTLLVVFNALRLLAYRSPRLESCAIW